eukprot:140533-Pyramimonas_sp.AAC.1
MGHIPGGRANRMRGWGARCLRVRRTSPCTLGSARNRTVMGPADLQGLAGAPLRGLHLKDVTIYNVNATDNQTFACNPFVEVRANHMRGWDIYLEG